MTITCRLRDEPRRGIRRPFRMQFQNELERLLRW